MFLDKRKGTNSVKAVNPVIKKETTYISIWTMALSLIMQGVIFFMGKWNSGVLLGNLLGGAAAVLNFCLMCKGILAAVEKDEQDAKTMIRMSRTLRMFMLLAVAAIGAVFSFFNTWTVLISLFFPRIAIFFWPLFNKSEQNVKSEDKHE